MGRYNALIGPPLRASASWPSTEAAMGVAVLNRMLTAGRLDFVRCLPVMA